MMQIPRACAEDDAQHNLHQAGEGEGAVEPDSGCEGVEERTEECDTHGDACLLHRRDETAAQSREPVGDGADDCAHQRTELHCLTRAEDECRTLEPQMPPGSRARGDPCDAEESRNLQPGAQQHRAWTGERCDQAMNH